MTKILFTGGHHNSALATIDWLKSKDPNLEFVWIGRRVTKSIEDSPEFIEVTKRNIEFYNLDVAGKIYRFKSPKFLFNAILDFIAIPLGFMQAFLFLLMIRPSLVVSFGGYLAVPVAVVGRIMGIRVITHEQTAVIGLANSVIGRFADKILVTWPLTYYSNYPNLINKMIYTGLPLREQIHTSGKLDLSHKLHTIYITGGKSGSSFLNDLVLDNLVDLVKVFNIIWSHGLLSIGQFNRLEKVKKELEMRGPEIVKRLVAKNYFYEDEIGIVLNTADFLISRSGAHTVYELVILKKPAILVPIPWSSNNEQRKNAEILKDLGLAKILDQETLGSKEFLSEVLDFNDNLDKYKISGKASFLVHNQGTEKVGNEILATISKNNKPKVK